MNKKLYRDEYHRVLGGVCSGLAEYFDMDVTVVRLLFAFTLITMGAGLIPYIVLWIVLPRKGYLYNNLNNPTVDYTVPPRPQTGNPFGGNPFASNAPGADPFGGPFYSGPAPVVPPKRKSNAGMIIGVVLIIVGAAILVDNYDLFPDIDFETYWPVILVIIGCAMIISGQRIDPWHKKDWSEDGKVPPADTAETPENTDSNSTI